MATLVSTRLAKHYNHIVEDLDRSMLGYDLIKQINKLTEDEPGGEYFELLKQTFEALDDPAVAPAIIRFWFSAQLLRLSGHEPNLQTDAAGQKLKPGLAYNFDHEHMCLVPAEHGRLTADHIKFLRLSFAAHPAKVLAQVRGSAGLLDPLSYLVIDMFQAHLRV